MRLVITWKRYDIPAKSDLFSQYRQTRPLSDTCPQAVTYYEEVTKSRHRQKDDELLHGSGMENFEAWTSEDINKAVKKGQGLIKQMHQENEWTTQRLLLKAGKMRDVHRELRKRALESDKVALDANAGTKVFQSVTE